MLTNLPIEIIHDISNYLPINDLLQFRITNQLIYNYLINLFRATINTQKIYNNSVEIIKILAQKYNIQLQLKIKKKRITDLEQIAELCHTIDLSQTRIKDKLMEYLFKQNISNCTQLNLSCTK